jgi:hypothetical protein
MNLFIQVLAAVRTLQDRHSKTDYNWNGFPFFFRDQDVTELLPNVPVMHIFRAIIVLKKAGAIKDVDVSKYNEFGYTYTINY